MRFVVSTQTGMGFGASGQELEGRLHPLTTAERASRAALYLFVATIPFDMPNRGIPIDLPSIGLLIFILVTIFMCRVEIWPIPAAVYFFGAFVFLGVVSTILVGPESPGESLKLVLQIAGPLITLFIIANVGRNPGVLRQMLRVFLVACTCRAALQLAGIATTNLGHWQAEERFTAFGQNPNNASANLGIALLMLAGLISTRRQRPASYVLSGCAALALCAAIVQMGSRGAIIALLAGMVTFLLTLAFRRTVAGKRRGTAFALIAVIAFVGLILSSESTRYRFGEAFESGNISGREVLYPTLIGMCQERPLFGWGFVNNEYELGRRIGWFNEGSTRRATHNLLLTAWSASGLLGTLPLAFGLALCMRAAWRARKGPQGSLPMALMVAAISLNMSQDWLESKLFWVVLAYALASAPKFRPRLIALSDRSVRSFVSEHVQ